MARSMLAGMGAALADLVLPRTCAGCGIPGAMFCAGCAELLARPRPAAPRRVPWGFPPTAAAGAYAGPVRPAVLEFKERGRAELARPLGAALALAVAAVVSAVPGPLGPWRPVTLVPVPSSRAGLRSRGRDHVRELTVRAVAELRAAGVPAAEARLLRRRGHVRDSAGLSVAQRRANLSGTFQRVATRPPPAPGALLVVVDDVVTTGATLTEAAAALAAGRPAGATPVLAAVVAATPRAAPERAPQAHLHVVPKRSENVCRGPGDRLSGPDGRD
ncbi:putative amidophosphoribosyltransferase [Blastococcus colisei]|uniref:Putative amidophosphoribosyltransferase n=1 Tax=Blastococcus colisei TaxID=1564162 RepID=A0A543PC11_9ACTN|nr:phosphoribosyltransferase family protein [Blastococcus colisei]TQN41550.1 putative amidophosphoribosyltransferase [Blastococcus colisei]